MGKIAAAVTERVRRGDDLWRIELTDKREQIAHYLNTTASRSDFAMREGERLRRAGMPPAARLHQWGAL